MRAPRRIVSSPASGETSPERILRSDDLPVPFAPTRPIRSCGPIENAARSKMIFGPKASESWVAETRLMARPGSLHP